MQIWGSKEQHDRFCEKTQWITACHIFTRITPIWRLFTTLSPNMTIDGHGSVQLAYLMLFDGSVQLAYLMLLCRCSSTYLDDEWFTATLLFDVPPYLS